MIADTRLSGVLHALLHLLGRDRPTSSRLMAKALGTNPVVVRRIMAGLRDQGYVTTTAGPRGGWKMASDPTKVTLLDIYLAIGEPRLFAVGNRSETPPCHFEQEANARLDGVLEAAEALIRRELAAMTLDDLRSGSELRLKGRTPRPGSLGVHRD